MFIDWICHTKSKSDLFLCTRNLYNKHKTGFEEYKINFWICFLELWIYKGYFVVKKLVRNVRIKAFWYTKIILNQTYNSDVQKEKNISAVKVCEKIICALSIFGSSRKAWLLITIFANSFSFSSSLFLGGKRKGEKNNQSRGQRLCSSAR